jgi:MFS family permease
VAGAALPRTYWLLWTGTLVNRLGSFVVFFLSLYLTKTRGLSVEVAGSIVSLYGAGSMLGGLTGGVLADRIGRRATLLAALVGGAVAMLALGLARPVWLIAAITPVVSFVTDLHRPAVGAMVADIVPPPNRRRAYGLLYWAINLGFAIASVVAGLLARLDYFILFVGDAATTLCYAVVVWRFIPETRPVDTRRETDAGFGEALSNRTYVLFLALAFLLALVFFQHLSTLPLAMAAHGHDEWAYGRTIAVNGILIVLLQPAATRALGRFPRGRVLAAATVVTGVGFGMYAFASSTAAFALGVGLWTLGEIASSPLQSVIVADLAPPHARGRYQGLFTMTWGLAFFAGPALGAWVLGRFSPAALWLGCLGACLATAAGYLALGPRLGGDAPG